MAKPKTKQSDNLLMYIVCGAVVLVGLGYAGIWFYFQQTRLQSDVSYATYGPMVVRAQQFSIKTTIAVQTSKDHASWLGESKKELEFALQTALANTNQSRIRQPDGVAYLQEELRDAINTTLKTKNVQQILLTDFIIQSN